MKYVGASWCALSFFVPFFYGKRGYILSTTRSHEMKGITKLYKNYEELCNHSHVMNVKEAHGRSEGKTTLVDYNATVCAFE